MKELLKLARETLKYYFEGEEYNASDEVKRKYNEKRACFVTLTKKCNLRGCVGSIIPSKKLWVDVQENAINSAFHDTRFLPLKKDELKDIKIEISVLTLPEKLSFKDSDELLKKLNKNLGVIIKKGFNQAVYLPQVWEEIAGKKEFLGSLCMKAGLHRDCWKEKIEVYVFRVEKVKED